MEAQYLRAQRMESIGTLAGGIAHDLNNVLAPIMMSIERLRLDTGDAARRNRILDTIQVSSRRGADLVKQVLSFSRGLDGERVTVRLRHLVDELQGIIRETFPRNITSVAEVSDRIWPVTGDPTQLHQVLLNLAVNARDAMPNGGTLTFTASNLTLDDHYAGMTPEAKAGTYVLLDVTDTGEGMPPEVRERIFEPFFTTKELGKGTGLGLATVHTIVKSHGGFLTVESAVGRGTTFKIYLPADPDLRAAATAHPFPADLPRGRNELVLVVDDEASIREITQRTLETFGYRVLTAHDGAAAVALYSQRMTEIALVLTDMMMPVMDGASSIKILKRMNPAVKIIAASGLDAKEHVAKAASGGVKDFLAKPYTALTLLRLVRDVIDRPEPPVIDLAPPGRAG
jgi:CheY-like chemotaxis protein